MAYRRSLLTRVIRLREPSHPSFSYLLHKNDDNGKTQSKDAENNNFLRRGYHSGMTSLPFLPAFGVLSSSRNFSSGADKMDYIKDVTEILTDKNLDAVTQAPGFGDVGISYVPEAVSQAPVLSEVAIAAADSYFPVAVLQYIIDGVHTFTGLNWWASIVLTTIMIRGATIPLLINQLKASSKLATMKPQLEEIKERMQSTGMEPGAVADGQRQMKALFKQYGVTPFTPMKGLLIQGPVFISFFLAIRNMAEKVPSFKQGGALWFTDLTTPDALYVFPILTALTFLITVEFNMQEGMEGNPMAGTMKTFSRIIGVLTVPFTMGFPKAIFCYWITSNCFSFMYGFVIKRPGVKKLLKLPEYTPPPPSTKQPAFDMFSEFKKMVSASKPSTTLITDKYSSDKSDRKISPSSVVSQRIRTLEKQVKGRKKNKKR